MPTYKSIELTNFPNINDFENFEEYFDVYYSIVLEYPLIFIPKNKIIFWGIEVEILKKEYDLLKEIIKLSTYNQKKAGYTEEELIQNINYKRTTSKYTRIEAYRRFIITSTSRIKKALQKKLVRICLDTIIANKYNPFIKGKIQEKDMRHYFVNVCKKQIPKIDRQDKYIMRCTRLICKYLEKDKDFEKRVLSADLNLIKIFYPMLNFTKPYNTTYASFVFNNAFSSLMSSVKNQRQKSKHRRFKTDFIFCKELKRRPIDSGYVRIRGKDKYFSYAKITPPKFNLCNFVNYPTSNKK